MTGFLPPLLQPDRRIDNSGRLEDLYYLIDEPCLAIPGSCRVRGLVAQWGEAAPSAPLGAG